MADIRSRHSATLLPNGRVLVAGGYTGSGYQKSAEIYNPATAKWTATVCQPVPKSMTGSVVLTVSVFGRLRLAVQVVVRSSTAMWLALPSPQTPLSTMSSLSIRWPST